jgi:flagellin-like hook-associated protein FlgL
MSGDVVIGASMRANLLSLQQTNSLLDTTQYKLSTGRKVNSALDNPQSFFAAQALTNRAGDLGRLLDRMGQSIQTIKEADKGITSLTKLVEQADAIANQAKDEIAAGAAKASVMGDRNIGAAETMADLSADFDGTTLTLEVGDSTAQDIAIAGTDTVDEFLDNVNTALEGYAEASINSAGKLEIRALNDDDTIQISSSDSSITSTLFSKLGLSDYLDETTLTGTVVQGKAVASAAVVGKAATDTVDGSFVTLADPADTVSLTLTIDGQTSDAFDITGTTTIQDLVNDINGDTKINSKVTASFDADSGTLKITGRAGVSTVDVSFEADAGNSGDATLAFGFGAGTTDGALAAAATVNELVSLSGSGNLGQLEKDFNEIRKQIDSLVNDASYRGVNLLKGDELTTIFNEDRTSSLVTKGADLSSTGLGISVAQFSSESSVDSALAETKAALDGVRAFGSSIANSLSVIQTREDFTKETVNTLTEGADKLTIADSNEEGARMLALQTRLQLGVTSLSLASQSAQSVLRMF